MFARIAYYRILGKPLMVWLGIITFLSILFTALIGYLNFIGIHTISFKWHLAMAIISIILAIIHGLLGILTHL
jgi:hypothetical protein